MDFASALLYALFLLQFSFEGNAKNTIEKILKDRHNNVIKNEDDGGAHRALDPALNVFFKVNDLHVGKKMMIYLAANENFAHTRLLSREEAESIPFASAKLSYLLDFFSFSNESPQAKAMETTLKQCELKPKGGEIKFCATSLELMLDMTRDVLGVVKPKVLTTKILNSNHTLFQEYTFVEKPLEIYAPKMTACHTMAYPYLVYYCHGQKGHFNRVFKIALRGENGERVEGAAICHMDTSTWDPDHVAFQVLGGQPGSSPVCHFLPADNLVWLSST